jgi:hypothetical protein
MIKDYIKVKGTFRLNITEDKEGKEVVVGDSGWVHNQIVNNGFRYYMSYALGAIAGSAQVSSAALGTSGAPAAGDTALGGEVVKRKAVTAASSADSKGVRFTATFGSSDSFVTATVNISNMGLFNSSGGGSMFSGNAFASSSCATNQNVNITYDITFA